MTPATYYTPVRVGVLMFALIAGMTLALTPVRAAEQWPVQDATAERDFIAPERAEFISDVLTQAARDEAAAAVEISYRFDPFVSQRQAHALRAYLDAIAGERRGELPPGRAIGPIPRPAEESLLALSDDGFNRVRGHAPEVLALLLDEPIRPDQLSGLRQRFPGSLSAELSFTEAALLASLVDAHLEPTELPDPDSTRWARAAAARAVPPVARIIENGEVIVARGRTVDPLAAEAFAKIPAPGPRALIEPMIAAIILSVIAAGAMGLFLVLTKPAAGASDRRMFVFGLVTLLAIAALRGWLEVPLQEEGPLEDWELMAPIVAAPLLIGAVLSPSLALASSVLIAVFAGFAVLIVPEYRGEGLPDGVSALRPTVVFLLSAIAAVIASTRVQMLSHFATAALAAGGTVFIAGLVFWPFEPERELLQIAWLAVPAASVAAGAAVIAILLFQPLAAAAGVTTRIRLLEAGQLAQPLLQRLQRETPGTFAHAAAVAFLAERAAARIGADSLLCRVGAYYLDIGKLANPHMHAENRDGGDSPHAALSPRESAREIISHVQAGAALAREAGLPAPVRAFIAEHHGTRRVNYFYRRAAISDPNVDPAMFSYPGPKPHTRETAIVMLADSCESVIRSSPDRDRETIELLVDRVIEERIDEGQLESCALTLRNLADISASFKESFAHLYHRRPAPTPQPAAAPAPPAAQGPS